MRLSNDMAATLVNKWQVEGCKRSRDQVVLAYKWITSELAYEAFNEQDREDVSQIAFEGIIRACNTYSEDKGSFEEYAVNEAMDEVLMRYILPEYLGISE